MIMVVGFERNSVHVLLADYYAGLCDNGKIEGQLEWNGIRS
jgi:hypothetical protein